MTTRTFPTEAEVTAWIEAHIARDRHHLQEREGVSIADQKVAATDHTNIISEQVGTVGQITGLFPVWFRGDNDDGHVTRAAASVLLVAERVGVTPLCPHTDELKPLILMADPPVIYCTDCSRHCLPLAMSIGYQYDHECDRCGRRVSKLRSSMVNFGNLLIYHHTCASCFADDQRHHDDVKAGRNDPCPCGSGRKYKRCCGASV